MLFIQHNNNNNNNNNNNSNSNSNSNSNNHISSIYKLEAGSCLFGQRQAPLSLRTSSGAEWAT